MHALLTLVPHVEGVVFPYPRCACAVDTRDLPLAGKSSNRPECHQSINQSMMMTNKDDDDSLDLLLFNFNLQRKSTNLTS